MRKNESSKHFLLDAKNNINAALALLEETEREKPKFKWVLRNKQHMCEPVYCISSRHYSTMEEAIEEIERFGLYKVMGRLEE